MKIKNSLRKILTFIVLLICLLLIALQVANALLVKNIRKQIFDAEKVDLYICMYPNQTIIQKLVTLEKKENIESLSKSFKVAGFSLPFDELIGGGYIIKIYENGIPRDIVVKRNGVVFAGRYPIHISDYFFEEVNNQIKINGGKLPDWENLFNNFKKVSENK